jgi:hypothetical protein
VLRFVREVENKKEGHARRARVEGHACHARRSGMDHPTYGSGPDKRVPSRKQSEGHVYRARVEGHACHAR